MLNPNLGVLLITHYQRLLNYIKPDRVHVLARGRIIKSGGTRPRAPARGGGLRPASSARPATTPTSTDAADWRRPAPRADAGRDGAPR